MLVKIYLYEQSYYNLIILIKLLKKYLKILKLMINKNNILRKIIGKEYLRIIYATFLNNHKILICLTLINLNTILFVL